MISYLENEKKYAIKDNSNSYSFSIEGEKKIIYITRDRFSLKRSNNISILCGVIIESNFKFEKNDVLYKHMLAHMIYENDGTPCILFHFFENANDSNQYLGGKYFDYENTILAKNDVIQFDRILESSHYVNLEKSKDYIKIRNYLKFIDKFAKECKEFEISIKFKEDLLHNCIKTCFIGDEMIIKLMRLKIGINANWENYLEPQKDWNEK